MDDCGGLKHVSLDTFNCFKTIEQITYKLISEGHYNLTHLYWPKCDFLLGINIRYLQQRTIFRTIKGGHWFMVCHIRGFSIANEEYKIRFFLSPSSMLWMLKISKNLSKFFKIFLFLYCHLSWLKSISYTGA